MAIAACNVSYLIEYEDRTDQSRCSRGYIQHPQVFTGSAVFVATAIGIATAQAARVEMVNVPNPSNAAINAFQPDSLSTSLTATEVLDIIIALDLVAASTSYSAQVRDNARAASAWINTRFVGVTTWFVSRQELYFCTGTDNRYEWRSLAECECGGAVGTCDRDSLDMPSYCV